MSLRENLERGRDINRESGMLHHTALEALEGVWIYHKCNGKPVESFNRKVIFTDLCFKRKPL